MAGSKYDITSGLAEYESLYYDVGVDKYIEGVKSLKDTYDKNVAGTSLIKEAAAKMDFMPNDEYARTYLEEGVNNILESAMEAPETATSQVNKAMQFFTSDPKLSQFRRNAAEFNKTEQIALNTPGGWSSMIMFGQNPLDFKTENDDGSLNVYQHTAEQRLDQSTSFMNMVGTIAEEAGQTGSMYEDIDEDGLMDILVNKTWRGVTNKRADEIVNGIMEQFITGSPEGVQALREMMEPVGGNAPITTDREEAKRLLYERMRPLIQNQVTGWKTGQQAAQISGGGGGGGDDKWVAPSLLLRTLQGTTTEYNTAQLESLGVVKDASFDVGQTMLNDYASAIDLGFLNEVDSDFEIVPGFKPFEGLEGSQKTQRILEVLQVLQKSGEGQEEEAAELALSIPGFKEALQQEADNPGDATLNVFENLRKFQNETSELSLDAQHLSLGVALNLPLDGAVMKPGTSVENKVIYKNGKAVLALKVKGWISAEDIRSRAKGAGGPDTKGLGKPGWQFLELYKWKDIDEVLHPVTKKPLFTKGKADPQNKNSADGYYFDTWIEKEINQSLQQQIDNKQAGLGTLNLEEVGRTSEQIEEYGAITSHFQGRKMEYLQTGQITYTYEGTKESPRPVLYNIKSLGIKPGSALDLKIQNVYDIMTKASVAAKTRGVPVLKDTLNFEAHYMTKLVGIIGQNESDEWKEAEVQKLIKELKIYK